MPEFCSAVIRETRIQAEGGKHFRKGDLEVGGGAVSHCASPWGIRRLWTATLRRCRTWEGSKFLVAAALLKLGYARSGLVDATLQSTLSSNQVFGTALLHSSVF